MEIAYENEFAETRLTPDKIKMIDVKSLTCKEYDEYMGQFGDLIRESYCEYIDPVSHFQDRYMREFLRKYYNKEYGQPTVSNKVRAIVIEIVEYMIDESQSGNSIFDGLTEDVAYEVQTELWDVFGHMLLDCEVYEGNGWTVDAIFGGSYCPWWDGWTED